MLIRKILCIPEVTQGEIVCSNPSIIWEAIGCVNLTCELNTTTGCLEIQYDDEDCAEPCLRLTISCPGDCNKCGSITKTVCFCALDADCTGDCDSCVGGVCTPPVCPDAKYLDTDCDCVDCLNNSHCPCDQTCVQGSCVCAPGFFKNSLGCCVECDSTHPCPDCEVCVGGDCIPKVCPDGVCSEDVCVDCLVASDCSLDANDHLCCENKDCVCCPGYMRDPGTGDCIEEPECLTEEDCPACSSCVSGDCEPIVCPAGYIAVATGDDCDCKRICDCDAPTTCGTREFCTPLNNTECYCKECEGPCDSEMDCGDGCTCVLGQCVNDDGCDGPCTNSTECAPGCGCKNERCISCADLDCATNECANVEGCRCNGNACVDDNCAGACSDGTDCGPGCGCLDYDCVSCSNVSCSNGESCPQGCSCNELTGVCQDNPCSNTFCSTGADCGQGCGCENGLCVPCNTLDCPGECNTVDGCVCTGNVCGPDEPDGCDDNLRVTRINSGCDIMGTLTTSDCCPCDEIALGFLSSGTSIVSNVGAFTLTGTLRKGTFTNFANFASLPALSATGILNDLPTIGTVRVRVTTTYREVDGNNNFTLTTPVDLTSQSSFVYNSVGAIGVTFSSVAFPGATTTISGNPYIATRTRITAKSTIQFSVINGCTYDLPEVVLYNFTGSQQMTNALGSAHQLGRASLCRTPLFRWYKHTSASGIITSGNNFRSLYAPGSLGTYTDTIYTYAEGLDHNKFYGLTTDCGCDPVEYYSCGNDDEGTPDKLIFCDPTSFSYSLNACGLGIIIEGDVLVTCDVYLDSSPRPSYKLYINNVLVDTRVLPSSGILYADGVSFASTTPINSVVLKIVDDTCNLCNVTGTRVNSSYIPIDVTMTYQATPCTEMGDLTLTVCITGGTPLYDYALTFNNVAVPIVGAGTTGAGCFDIVITGASGNTGTYELTVTDADNCEKVITIFYDATANEISNLISSAFYSCVNGLARVRLSNVSGLDANAVLNPPVGANVTQFLPGLGITDFYLTNGTNEIIVTIIGYPLCTVTFSFEVSCCTAPESLSVSYSCTTGFSGYPSGYTFLSGLNVLSQGQFLNAGSNVVVAVAPNGCQFTLPLIIPQCYTCDAGSCVPAITGNNTGYSSLGLCQASCENPCPNIMAISSYVVSPGILDRCHTVVVVEVENGIGGILLMGAIPPNFTINNGANLIGFWYGVTEGATVNFTFNNDGCNEITGSVVVATCNQTLCPSCVTATATLGCVGPISGIRVNGGAYLLSTYGGSWGVLVRTVLQAIGETQLVGCKIEAGNIGTALRIYGPPSLITAIDGIYDSCGNLKTTLGSCLV